jgi:hypothetical protein
VEAAREQVGDSTWISRLDTLAGYMLQQRINGHELGVCLTACQSYQIAKCNMGLGYGFSGAFTNVLICSIYQHHGYVPSITVVTGVKKPLK